MGSVLIFRHVFVTLLARGSSIIEWPVVGVVSQFAKSYAVAI